jgi:hypothetical protein
VTEARRQSSNHSVRGPARTLEVTSLEFGGISVPARG